MAALFYKIQLAGQLLLMHLAVPNCTRLSSIRALRRMALCVGRSWPPCWPCAGLRAGPVLAPLALRWPFAMQRYALKLQAYRYPAVGCNQR